MLTAVLILFLILIYTLQSFLCKLYSDAYPGDPSMASPVYSVASGLVTVLVTFGAAGFVFDISPAAAVLGTVNAAVLAGYNICFIAASSMGSYSVMMTALIAGGIIIPTLSGVAFFGDRPGIFKYLSLVLVIGAVYLITRPAGKTEETGEEEKKKSGGKFALVCVLLGIFNGCYGALLDAQQRLTGNGEKEEMVIVTYLLMAVGMFVWSAFRRRGKLWGDFRQTRRSGLFLVIASVVVALAINLLTFLIHYVGDISMVCTFDNAGVMLFSTVFAAVFLKEKLSPANIAGVTLMCAGLVLTSIF